MAKKAAEEEKAQYLRQMAKEERQVMEFPLPCVVLCCCFIEATASE